MCGIIGYAGKENACDQLIAGLKKLEYRGYDSAGIALAENGKIKIFKTAGKVAELEASIPQKTASNLGMGHTRWATHGAPDTINAHPHRAGKVTLVHNGIIENEKALRTRLNAQGKTPLSDTDTELIALLTDTLYQGNPIQTLSALQRQLEGSFALGVLFEDHPQTLYALRKDSPLLIGLGDEEYFIASDLTAFLERTRRYLLLEQGEIAEISFDAVRVFAPDGTPVSKQEQVADWGNQQAERGGFAHYMLKEIFEQPQAIKNTLEQVAALPFSPPAGKICIVGCGSAYHAALPGKRAFMNHAKIPAEAHIASEFRYADPLLNQEDLLIAISQSGETADTLAALRLAKKKGVPTLGIVNVRGSSIAREADTVFYTAAGPEISVATTKAYLCQWLTLEILARKAANLPLLPLRQLPLYIEKALEIEGDCRKAAEKLADAEHLFFIGRGKDYDLCREASLKLKEVSYIHSEAYAAGELKHGTISLIESGTPVVALAADQTLLSKTAANVRELQARGALVLAIAPKEAPLPDCLRLNLPDCPAEAAPFLAAVLCQMIAYHTAKKRGNEIDQPRNLAKSVTVE